MTRVLLVDPSYKGALPLYTAMIAQALSASGAQPIILGHKELIDPGLDGDWPVLRQLQAPKWPLPAEQSSPSAIEQGLGWIRLAGAVWQAARKSRPDVVHFQHPLHPRLDSHLLRAVRTIAPTAWTAHDVLPHDGGSNEEQRARAIYRASGAVIVHSEPARDLVRRISGVEATVIEHPVRSLQKIPEKIEARRRFGIDPEMRVLGAVGFIRAYKGYGLLADALQACNKSNLRILIAGELIDESERMVIGRLEADGRSIIRLGYQSEADIIDIIAASDALLLPHAGGSDSGSLHMARSVGRPVIAAATPQLAAAVTATRAGLVLQRDALAWASAFNGPLPPPPPPPPTMRYIGERHRLVYASIGLDCGRIPT